MGKTDRGRGALTTAGERNDILLLIADAIASGCRQNEACEAISIECRTLQRWQKNTVDGRHGPLTVPANKLSIAEKALVIKTSVSAEFVNLRTGEIIT